MLATLYNDCSNMTQNFRSNSHSCDSAELITKITKITKIWRIMKLRTCCKFISPIIIFAIHFHTFPPDIYIYNYTCAYYYPAYELQKFNAPHNATPNSVNNKTP